MVRAPDPTWRDRLRRLIEPPPRPLPRVPPPASVERALERLRREATGPVELSPGLRSSPDTIIGAFPLAAGTGEESLEAQVTAFVDRHRDVFGLSDVSAELRLRGARDEGGPLGWMVEFSQVWREVPVWPGGLKINVAPDGRTLRFVSNDITPVEPGTSVEPRLSAPQAVAAARRYATITLRPARSAGEPRLVVASDPTRGFWSGVLAWELRLTSGLYHVDAATGRARHVAPSVIH